MKLPAANIVETSNVSVTSAGRDLIEQTQQKFSGTTSNITNKKQVTLPASQSQQSHTMTIESDMLGEDEYESLPASVGLKTYMIAGAMAGILEHCAVYPLDSVKTRMQSILPQETCRYKGVTDAFKTISKTEGMFRTVKGINVVAVGAGPAHALYFSCYEVMKRKFSSVLQSKTGQSPVANATAGFCATFIHDTFMNPAEVVKHRLQMSCSPYKGAFDCIRTVYAQEGIPAFYRSFGTAFLMNAPFQMTHFTCYEYLQELLNPSREWNPWTHCAAGGIAGALAAAITTPMDVCKTVLNTQEQCVTCNLYTGPATVSGPVAAVKTIYEAKGLSGFFSGIRARVLFQMPATALSWSVYELFKYIISNRNSSSSLSSSHQSLKGATTGT